MYENKIDKVMLEKSTKSPWSNLIFITTDSEKSEILTLSQNFWNSLEIAIIHCSFISLMWFKCILLLYYTSNSTYLLYCIFVSSDLWLTSPKCWPPVTTNCPSYLRHPTSYSGSGDSVVCLWPRYIVDTTNTVASVSSPSGAFHVLAKLCSVTDTCQL